MLYCRYQGTGFNSSIHDILQNHIVRCMDRPDNRHVTRLTGLKNLLKINNNKKIVIFILISMLEFFTFKIDKG